MASLKRYTDFLSELGIDEIPHSEKTYLGHLVAVHNKLAAWEYAEHVCLAGLFHSIYGTEIFQGFKLEEDRRNELLELIGERAEKLAYVNCFVDRATLDLLTIGKGKGATSPLEVRTSIENAREAGGAAEACWLE